MPSKLFDILIRYRSVSVIIWTILAIACAYPAILYFTSTSMYFAPPKGSISHAAQLKVNQTFSNLTHAENQAIFVQDKTG